MGNDSTSRKVLSLHKGNGKLYKIIPRYDGYSFVVNGNHILSLIKYKDKSGHSSIRNMEVNEILKRVPASFHHSHKLYRMGVEFPSKKLDISPYFLGLWLGDGSSSSVQVETADKKIVEYLFQYAKELNLQLVIKEQKGSKSNTYGITRGKSHIGVSRESSLQNILRKNNLINNKHIPLDYLRSSMDDRFQLLAGLIDSDGYLDRDSGFRYEIIQKNKRLSNDILYLARSLGFGVKKHKSIKGIKSIGFVGEYQRMYITGDLSKIPCKLKRKQCPKRKRIKRFNSIDFKIESVGIGDYYGFEISGNHLFLLKDFIVTHNTLWAKSLLQNLSKKGERAVVFQYESPYSRYLKSWGENPPLFYLPLQLRDKTSDWLEERIREAKQKYNINIVIIDPINKLLNYEKRQSPTIQINSIVGKLKDICLEYNVIIFVLAHARRLEKGANLDENMIRESQILASESDRVWIIDRIVDKQTKEFTADTQLIISLERESGFAMGKRVMFRYDNGLLYEKDANGYEEIPDEVETQEELPF